MIYVYGSIARDFIFEYSGDIEIDFSIQKINHSFLASEFRETKGGTATNIAYNLRLLGMQCGILGIVGGDGGPYLDWLDSLGINTDSISLAAGYTSSSMLLTDRAGKQIIVFCPSVMNEVVAKCLMNFDWNMPSFVVVGAGLPEGINYLVSKCVQYSLDFLYNPGQSIHVLSREDIETAISAAKIILVNESEYLHLKEKLGGGDEKILKNNNLLAITFGREGSIIKNLHESVTFDAVSAPTMDPTGAGDAYCAGLVNGFIKKYPIDLIGKTASLLSSYAVQNHGSIEHRLSTNEFVDKFKEVYKEDLKL